LSDGVLGFLLAAGAGGMFYLTVTDLIPEAEEHQYQESSEIAVAAGFLTVFVFSAMT
jgi:zinc transporter, ZIP family